MAIIEAQPEVLGDYMEGKKDVEAFGHVIGSEESLNWLA